jgi:hypothetical protein
MSVDDVRPAVAALPEMPAVEVDDPVAMVVAHGRVLGQAELGVQGSGPWAVTDGRGELLAVYEAHGNGRAKPAVVLTSIPGPDQ